MEKLLLELRGSLQTEYEWVPTNTMITLYKKPGTIDPNHAAEYDLPCLIGHKTRKENTVYHENNVGFPTYTSKYTYTYTYTCTYTCTSTQIHTATT